MKVCSRCLLVHWRLKVRRWSPPARRATRARAWTHRCPPGPAPQTPGSTRSARGIAGWSGWRAGPGTRTSGTRSLHDHTAAFWSILFGVIQTYLVCSNAGCVEHNLIESILYFVFNANESIILVKTVFRITIFVHKILRILYRFTFTHHYCWQVMEIRLSNSSGSMVLVAQAQCLRGGRTLKSKHLQ